MAKRKQAFICIDPGITTGMAVISDPDGYLIATTNWTPDNVEYSLDTLIRALHLEGFQLTAVVEQMPHVGKNSPLERDLERVRRSIMNVLDIYDILTLTVTPGEWKPSRVAKAAVLPETWEGKPLTAHQKDAIRMGCYRLEKKYASR